MEPLTHLHLWLHTENQILSTAIIRYRENRIMPTWYAFTTMRGVRYWLSAPQVGPLRVRKEALIPGIDGPSPHNTNCLFR